MMKLMPTHMTRLNMTRLIALVVLAFSLLLSSCSIFDRKIEPPRDPLEIRLYVFNCGEITFEDVSAFGISNDETPVRTLAVPCYLIDHPRGHLFWDGGLPTGIAGKGNMEGAPGMEMQYERSVLDQMKDINISPDEVEYLAFSDMHFDHVGAANAFTTSKLLIQQTEYQAAFTHGADSTNFNPGDYQKLFDNPKIVLDGDHDVFGDGRVKIISAPGPSPGHQVLFLDLTETGPILLSGDLYHFRESIPLRRTPEFSTSRAQTLNSMNRVSAVLAKKRATLWIQHEKAFADTLTLSPEYYR
ncbi:MAG: N-acyl homoserine lactone hydrolase [Candidatus Azotimanducaceae bacterium]|jgi:N-acyl homoserine lactone hydrolase